jgi:hypothetical protein
MVMVLHREAKHKPGAGQYLKHFDCAFYKNFGFTFLFAKDMPIGNLLGSNAFNILILVVDDAFYLRGPLLSHCF